MGKVNDDGGKAGTDVKGAPARLTEQDLLLGKRAAKIMGTLYLVGFLICLVIAVYVFQSVPLDTRMPYQGRYSHSGRGIPMPVAMAVMVIVLFLSWKGTRRPTANHMRRWERTGLFIVGPIIILGCIYGQCIFAEAILAEGGALPS
ncbi:hypothetical protein KKR91_07550 [Arthrobacter jiangjiafuii]|uniref:Uncharacterized protein n=1 Tax=Arthrobacter jiangjiafuii TaxID=2817475 RepID=A0A975M7M8_9MICC|nr:hypothetical protein [Arthrobacter jiangjiafuii]MBP3044454.1 hypothetical protein [Arthrobacter jiangjiafuii]QWC11397.1 hypothetical protein KKR91_07550 [Arthrobacter jiangjiafuii]